MRWLLAIFLLISARGWTVPIYSEDWESYSAGTALEGGVEDSKQYWVDFGNAGTATVENASQWTGKVARMAPSTNWWGASNTKTAYQYVTFYARVSVDGRLSMAWSHDGTNNGTVPTTGQAYQHIVTTYYGYASGGLAGSITTTDTYDIADDMDFDLKIIRDGNDWYVEIDGDAAGNWTLSGADSGGFYLGAFGSNTEYDDIVVDDGTLADAVDDGGFDFNFDFLFTALTKPFVSPLYAAQQKYIDTLSPDEKEHYLRGLEIQMERAERIAAKKAARAELEKKIASGEVTMTPTPTMIPNNPTPTPTATPER